MGRVWEYSLIFSQLSPCHPLMSFSFQNSLNPMRIISVNGYPTEMLDASTSSTIAATPQRHAGHLRATLSVALEKYPTGLNLCPSFCVSTPRDWPCFLATNRENGFSKFGRVRAGKRIT